MIFWFFWDWKFLNYFLLDFFSVKRMFFLLKCLNPSQNVVFSLIKFLILYWFLRPSLACFLFRNFLNLLTFPAWLAYKGSLQKKKNGNILVFYQYWGGEYPPTNIFPFFSWRKTFIALKWSTCSKTCKKWINFFSQLWPPP